MHIQDMDMTAVELYTPQGHHAYPCLAPLSLFDRLTGKCPKCGGVIVAGPDIAAEEAAEMLMMLQARRVELGLKP